MVGVAVARDVAVAREWLETLRQFLIRTVPEANHLFGLDKAEARLGLVHPGIHCDCDPGITGSIGRTASSCATCL